MKRNFKIFLMLLLCLSLAVPVHAAASSASASKVKNGWVQTKSGKKYYKKGVMLKGQHKIGKYYYYFSKKGNMTTGWVKENGKEYYYQKNGRAVIGAYKISNGKYYYFGNRGVRQKDVTYVKNGVNYYIDRKGYLDGKKIKNKFYYPNGKLMKSTTAKEYEALITARDILRKITTKNMSSSQMLQKCFAWVMKFPYVTRRAYTLQPGWTAVYAFDHFKLGGGNCQSDACAFAYLAKAIGYKNVYVCCDSRGRNAHSWTEIDGLVYDPLFAQVKGYSKNYAVRYGVYVLSPIVHQKI